jgi:hypothetical protein
VPRRRFCCGLGATALGLRASSREQLLGLASRIGDDLLAELGLRGEFVRHGSASSFVKADADSLLCQGREPPPCGRRATRSRDFEHDGPLTAPESPNVLGNA